MKAGAQWLRAVFGRRARDVAQAYQTQLQPEGRNGRLILADLAHYCRVGRSSFVPGDPHQTAFNEGARDVFLHIAEMIGLPPGSFTTIMESERD